MRSLARFFVILISVLLLTVGYQTLPIVASPNPLPETSQPTAGQNDRLDLSCARPATPDTAKTCREIEQQILASTVRLEWRLWIKEESDAHIYVDGNVGFGTIKEGRYVVTHNHIDMPLSGSSQSELTEVSVATTDGTYLWQNVPITAISVVVEDAETLVLDFGNEANEGMFEAHGLSSAEFRAWHSLPLRPGMEVAQIDWDRPTVRIVWVTIEDVIIEEGVPRLELASFVGKGASGGGVFWNGFHVANNWLRVTTYEKKDAKVVRQYSVVALNSPQVTALLP